MMTLTEYVAFLAASNVSKYMFIPESWWSRPNVEENPNYWFIKAQEPRRVTSLEGNRFALISLGYTDDVNEWVHRVLSVELKDVNRVFDGSLADAATLLNHAETLALLTLIDPQETGEE